LQSIDSWDGTSSTWGFHAGDTINNYYYEEFSTDIPELKDAGIQMKVYPVPANDQMAIEMTLDKVQDINIALYDLKGNIWNSWQKRMVKDFKENLQTSQLPSGNYIIQVKGSLGAYSSQCITVAH
jgi:hypothetical protein